ncbi:ABC transporter ATP-binding protein [Mesomycoplasma conjunctivae]|uniref:ABC transporter ATP-binding protein n=1 Tax=Mesomycoplasma conjunctivae TaxID=45361 RepID=UPI003DA50406
MKKYFYQEKKTLFGNSSYRLLTPGTLEMLNSDGREPLVSFQNVDVTYGSGAKKNKVIHDLSFNIYDGEVLSFVGESGSGKSTTGSALAGLVSHSHGQIKIGDLVLPQNKNKIKGKLLQKLVGSVQMIFQDPLSSLNPFKNIFAVVSEGIDNLEAQQKGAIKKIFFDNYNETSFYNIVSMLKKNQQINDEQYQSLKSFYQQIYEQNHSSVSHFLYDHIYSYLNSMGIQYPPIFFYLQQRVDELKKLENATTNQLKYQLVLELLASVGLDSSILKRFPLEFSGGQQQRIGISRALILKPKILIADEPISALDVSIQAQIINIFKDLKEKYNLTILFISHDLRMVEYISDRIAVINRGRLLEIGPTKEIINNFVHPYTKSLIEAIPTIESQGGSLLGYVYNPAMHNYDENNQPEWLNLGNNHFVLATKEELRRWKSGDYSYENKQTN